MNTCQRISTLWILMDLGIELSMYLVVSTDISGRMSEALQEMEVEDMWTL